MFGDIVLEDTLVSFLGVDIQWAFLVYLLVGLFAQSIDGALGMAYGVSSNSFLLSVGVPAPVASASVHLAEVATTAVSGFSHFKLGNIDKKLFRRLIIPGVIGSVLGAILLITVWDSVSSSGKVIIKIVISLYLLALGVRIFLKAVKNNSKKKEIEGRPLGVLAIVGGFSDAIGGGGWGPIVTSTLVGNGHEPRSTIGTVNSSEFFVTVAQVIVFLTMLSEMNWQLIAGLVIGGCIAAPFAARITKVIPARTMLFIVGVLIVGLQINTLIGAIPKLF